MKKAALYSLFLISLPASASASVLSISSPDVKQGEWSVEAGMGWEMDDGPQNDDAREYVLELGYSPTDYWNTAIELSAEQESGNDAEYAVTAWKNTLQFIKQTDVMPISAGLRLQYEKAHLDGEADEVAARILLRHQNDIIDARFNLGVEREVGSGADSDLEGDMRASLRYKWRDEFRPTIDYLGDMGSLNHMQDFDTQDHRAGPVFYGSSGPLSYEAGYLAGLSDEAPDGTFKIVFGVSF